MKIKRIALCGVLAALSVLFSYLEFLVPFSVGIFGVKLGLANLVTVFALYTLGPGYAAPILFFRILITALLFSNPAAWLYSVCGGLLSLAGMTVLRQNDAFSVRGVSICGGVLHNIGQLLCAAFLLDMSGVMWYLPVLLISGALAGFVIGLLADLLIKKLKGVVKWIE